MWTGITRIGIWIRDAAFVLIYLSNLMFAYNRDDSSIAIIIF